MKSYEQLWQEEQIRKNVKQQYPNQLNDPNYNSLIDKEANKALNNYNWSRYIYKLTGMVIGLIIVYIVASALKFCQ